MRAHAANTKEVVAFLETSDQVDQIFLPKVDGVQLTDYGGMLFFRMQDDEAGDKSDAFSSALNLFDRGTPMATVCSAVAIPYTGSHLSMTPDEKASIGLGKNIVRLSIGIETASDLIADLRQAFAQIVKK